MEQNLQKHIAQTLEGINPRLSRRTISAEKWSMEEMLSQIVSFGRTLNRNFRLDEHNREVYTNIVYWAMGDARMKAVNPSTGKIISGRVDKGLYIAGNVGTGKTTAMQIATQLYKVNPFRKPWQQDTIAENMVYRASDIVNGYEVEGYAKIVDIARCGYLVIEDLGTEPGEAVFMGNRRNVLRQLMENRGDVQSYAMSATSNIPLGHPDFIARYGQRAQSRVQEMTNYLVLTGDDRRKVL